jgi:uroporphyrinogen-III synthase
LGPQERWAPLCLEHRHRAGFLCVSPLRAVPRDDADFSLFLVDLFSGKYDVLVITCSVVIDAMVEMARKRDMEERLRKAINRSELVTIGDRTTSSATDQGWTVSSQSPEATTDALLAHLNEGERRGRIALLRSDQGSDQLSKGLEASGWRVEDVPVYSLLLDDSMDMQSLLDRLEDGELDALVFPTPAHVQSFLLQLEERCGVDRALENLKGRIVAAIGPETRRTLEEYGVEVQVIPERADPRSLLILLMERLQV